MKVSIYKNAFANTSKEHVDFLDVLGKIKSGTWEDYVHKIRTCKDLEKVKAEKAKCPAFSPSGFFEGKRKADELTKHSGIISIDFDAKDNINVNLLEMRAELYADKYTFAGFISISGKGIVLFVKINTAKHLESFLALEKYYANTYGLIIDQACKEVNRLRFVSYDTDVYINMAAEKWATYLEKKAKIPSNYIPVFVDDDVDYIISQIQRTNTDITDDYHEWIKIGFALANHYRESGRAKFHAISEISPKYDYKKADEKYTNFLKSENNKTHIATLFWQAKHAGLAIRTPKTEKIVNIASARRKQVGKSGGAKDAETGKKEAVKYLAEFEGIPEIESANLVEQVFNLTDAEIQTNDEQLSEIELLTNYVVSLDLKFNEVTDRLEYKGNDITDRDLNTIYLNARLSYLKSKFSKELFLSVLDSDRVKTFNPFSDFFERNKHIKPKGNIEKLLSCIVTENTKYADFVGTYIHKWLMGIVSSAHGTHSLLTLVLVGEQGTQKTNFFRNLLPKELSKYYAESKLDRDKDDELLMTRRLLVMDDEFGGKSKKEATKFKDLSSKETFTNRKPYGRFEEDRKRYAVLCGTSNERQILNDPTGNRRIIPVMIVNIDFEKYNKVDKKELFMELYHEWLKIGDGWFLSKDEIRILNENTDDFFEVTPEEDALLTYFERGGDFMTTTEMITYCENSMGASTRLYFKRFGQLCKKFKFKETKKQGRKGYLVHIIK